MKKEIAKMIDDSIKHLMLCREAAIEEGSDIYEVDKFIQEQSKKYMDRYHQMPLGLAVSEVIAETIVNLMNHQK